MLASRSGLTQIRLADRRFDLQQFLVGARAAFEMIIEAYAAGDKRTLRPLLADDVYAASTVRSISAKRPGRGSRPS